MASLNEGKLMSELSDAISKFRNEHKKIRDKYRGRLKGKFFDEYHIERKILSEYYLEKWPEFYNYPKAIGYPYRVLKESEEFLNGPLKTHGGARLGAGRKKEEPTKQIRLPVSIVEQIVEIRDLYKDLSDEKKLELIEQLKEFVEFSSHGD